MPFELPEKPSFDAAEWTRNKILFLNQFEETVVKGFLRSYEVFWEVSGSDQTKEIDGEQVAVFVGNGSRHTVEEMQACIDLIGIEGFVKIKTASDAMIKYIESQGGVVPDRYKSSPFEYQLGPNGIKLTKLVDVWAAPVVEESP